MNKLLRIVLDILTFGILEIVLYARKRMAAKTPQPGDFDQHPADRMDVVNSDNLDSIETIVRKVTRRRVKK